MKDLIKKEKEELFKLLSKMGVDMIDKAILLDERYAHDKRILEAVGERVNKLFEQRIEDLQEEYLESKDEHTATRMFEAKLLRDNIKSSLQVRE